ncbi:MAG TPA: protein kinase, partial [Ardenticatenaceae bacterium]
MTQTSDPWVGRRLGRYELRRKLGGGGSGAVYAAWDDNLEREVALKVMVPAPGAPPELLSRFHQEAILTARMNHPNIVPIYDVGEDEGLFYIAMRRLPGNTLGDMLGERGPLPQAEAIRVALPIAEALSYAHQRGIVHRDLKPANVLFDEEERALLADFGIAKALDTAAEGITVTGMTIGTPAYMSPEQASGSAVDHRSDIYSLGILLYQMVTGRPPYQGNAPTVMRAHLFETPTPPSELRPDLLPDLEKIILKAIAKRPDDRFGSVNEMLDSLRAVQRGEPTRISLAPVVPSVADNAAPPTASVAPTREVTPAPRRPVREYGPPPRRTGSTVVAAPLPPRRVFPIWTLTIFFL